MLLVDSVPLNMCLRITTRSIDLPLSTKQPVFLQNTSGNPMQKAKHKDFSYRWGPFYAAHCSLATTTAVTEHQGILRIACCQEPIKQHTKMWMRPVWEELTLPSIVISVIITALCNQGCGAEALSRSWAFWMEPELKLKIRSRSSV